VPVYGVVAARTENDQVVGAVGTALRSINDVMMMPRVADPYPATAARVTVALIDDGADASVYDAPRSRTCRSCPGRRPRRHASAPGRPSQSVRSAP